MKTISRFFFYVSSLLIVITNASAQDENKILIEYTVKRGVTNNKESLIATPVKAIYSVSPLLYEIENKKYADHDEETNTITINQKQIKLNASTFYKERNSDIVYFTVKKDNHRVLIKDSLPALSWKLVDGEEKKINNFICNKAILNYRGSTLVAYYTNEIPISFGPWKFKGLPGLILEIYNISEGTKYHWLASQIIYPFKTNISFNLPLDEYKVINYEEYIVEREEKIRNQMSILDVRAPKGVTAGKTTLNRTGIEKVFEWEEN